MRTLRSPRRSRSCARYQQSQISILGSIQTIVSLERTYQGRDQLTTGRMLHRGASEPGEVHQKLQGEAKVFLACERWSESLTRGSTKRILVDCRSDEAFK